MDGWWMGGWMDRRTDGWTDRWMDGQVDGRTGGWIGEMTCWGRNDLQKEGCGSFFFFFYRISQDITQ